MVEKIRIAESLIYAVAGELGDHISIKNRGISTRIACSDLEAQVCGEIEQRLLAVPRTLNKLVSLLQPLEASLDARIEADRKLCEEARKRK